MVATLAERGVGAGYKEGCSLTTRDLVDEGKCLELALKLERRPEADDRASPWPGLNNPTVSTGEFLSLSPAERAALMIMPRELRRQAMTSLYDRGDERLAQAVRTLSYNLAGELLSDGRLERSGRLTEEYHSEDHLTRDKCSYLMMLIGVNSDGEVVTPLSIGDLCGNDFERESKIVSNHIAPLMRKIRKNWGQDLLGHIKAKWKK